MPPTDAGNCAAKPELMILKERNGVLPLLHYGQRPRLNADRPRHDEGTTAWRHDRGGGNRGASVSEGITTEMEQAGTPAIARQGDNGT